MANKTTLGLSKIEIGTIANDGGVATTWATIGYTAENTATLVTEDGTTTDIYAEEVSAPIESITTDGKMSFNFSLASPDLTQLSTVFGGSVTGTSPNEVWAAPDSTPTIEKSLKVTPTKGLVLTFPRVSIKAKFSGTFTKNDTLKVEVVCTVLQPTKSGTNKLSATVV